MLPAGANSKLEIHRIWIFVLVGNYLAVAIVYYFFSQADPLHIWFLTISPFIFWLPPLVGVYQRKEWGYRLLQFVVVLALGSGFYNLVLVASFTDFGDAIYNIFLVLISVQVASAFAVVSLSSSSLKSLSVVAGEQYRPAEPTAPAFSSPQEIPAILTPPAYQTAERVSESRALTARLIVAVIIGIVVLLPASLVLGVFLFACAAPIFGPCSVEDYLRSLFDRYPLPFAISFALGAISGWICVQSIVNSFRRNQQWPRGFYGAIFGFFWGVLIALALGGFSSIQIVFVPFLGVVGMGVGFLGIGAIHQMVRALVLRE